MPGILSRVVAAGGHENTAQAQDDGLTYVSIQTPSLCTWRRTRYTTIPTKSFGLQVPLYKLHVGLTNSRILVKICDNTSLVRDRVVLPIRTSSFTNPAITSPYSTEATVTTPTTPYHPQNQLDPYGVDSRKAQ